MLLGEQEEIAMPSKASQRLPEEEGGGGREEQHGEQLSLVGTLEEKEIFLRNEQEQDQCQLLGTLLAVAERVLAYPSGLK